jgi:O-antigen/teichoic acid export membrane protein
MIGNNTNSSLRRSMGYQFISTLYLALLGFAVSVLLARELGVEVFGNYSYILSLAGIFLIFQDGGYKTLIFRESVDNNTTQSSLSLGVIHLILITLLGGLLVSLIQPQRWEIILTAFGCMGLVVLTGFVSSLLKGRGDFKLDAIWKIVIRSLTACAILSALFFYKANTIKYIFIAWSIALILALIWPIVKGYIKWPSFNFNNELFRSSMVFLSIDVATVFYFRSDIVLLEYLGNIEGDVGHYSAAYRILEGIILIATPVAQIAFRSLRLRLNQKKFYSLLILLTFAMLVIAGVFAGLGIFFSDDVILVVFGEQYQRAGKLLPILMFAMLFILPNYILTQGAIAINKEIYYAKIVCFVALLNILLNIWLIPDFGAFGAACATIFSEGVLFMGLVYVFWREWIGVEGANRG